MAKAEAKSGRGKKRQKSKKHSLSYTHHPENFLSRDLDMNIQLWYNKEVSQWRWTLSSATEAMDMESGSSPELEVALKDVKNTIEWMVNPSIA